jgi:hypothetical protein
MSVAGSNPLTQIVTVGAAAVQLPNMNANAQLTLKALSTNTGIIYVGPAGVTANTNGPTDGMELTAGQFVTIYAANANLYYAIASAASQKLCILAE